MVAQILKEYKSHFENDIKKVSFDKKKISTCLNKINCHECFFGAGGVFSQGRVSCHN